MKVKVITLDFIFRALGRPESILGRRERHNCLGLLFSIKSQTPLLLWNAHVEPEQKWQTYFFKNCITILFIHSLNQQIFIEHPFWGGHSDRCWEYCGEKDNGAGFPVIGDKPEQVAPKQIIYQEVIRTKEKNKAHLKHSEWWKGHCSQGGHPW